MIKGIGMFKIKFNIEKEIEYANASVVNATILKENIDDNSTIEPSGAIQNKKVGYEFEISYKPSSTLGRICGLGI